MNTLTTSIAPEEPSTRRADAARDDASNEPSRRRGRVWKRVGASVLALVALAGLAVAALCVVGWPASRHPTEPARLGVVRSTRDLEAVLDQPGPITVTTVVGADWQVDRGGLIDLNDPRARAAGLREGPEPIQIYFHALRHPTRGLFLVDTGVERAVARDPDHALITGVLARAMPADAMHVRTDTASWLAAQHEPLAGVLLTHLHLDHILGMRDVPAATPVYTGPGETRVRAALDVLTQPITDRALAGHGALREWGFAPDASGEFAGVLDVFGDGTLWAIAVPGHTPGSTAYLARTPRGPVLLAGDACHTAWGWDHGVAPGTFTLNARDGAASLARLRAFVARHPAIDVRLGHQPRLDAATAADARGRL